MIHQKALSFIEKNKNKSFFLYYASVLPHAELIAPETYMNKFIGKFESEKVYMGTESGENYKKGGGADPDYFNSNGSFRGHKRDLYEGGIRVPMIAKGKSKIAEGSTTNPISAFWDVMPMLAELRGIKINNAIDGISFLPTLFNKNNQKQHDYLYWEFHELGGRQALIIGNWKLVRYNVSKGEKYQLYHLKTDPGETKDIADRNKDLVQKMSKKLKSSRKASDVFKFN